MSDFSDFSAIKHTFVVMQQFCIRKSSIKKNILFQKCELKQKTVITLCGLLIILNNRDSDREAITEAAVEHN